MLNRVAVDDVEQPDKHAPDQERHVDHVVAGGQIFVAWGVLKRLKAPIIAGLIRKEREAHGGCLDPFQSLGSHPGRKAFDDGRQDV